MARCRLFPPPGYVLNGASGEALLELIKVRREKVAAEKRKKKERSRRTKGKGEWKEGKTGEKRCRHKRKRAKKCGDDNGDCQMRREIENQLLDRSILIEELDQPICNGLYDSSGNTENIKGKGHCWSLNGCYKHGSIQVDSNDLLVQEKSELVPGSQFLQMLSKN